VKGERRAVKITNKTAKLAQKCLEKATQMRRSQAIRMEIIKRRKTNQRVTLDGFRSRIGEQSQVLDILSDADKKSKAKLGIRENQNFQGTHHSQGIAPCYDHL